MAQVIVASGGGALSSGEKVSRASVKTFFSDSSLSAQTIIDFNVVYYEFLSHVNEELNKNPEADAIETFIGEFCSSFISKAEDALISTSIKRQLSNTNVSGNKLTAAQFYGLVGISFTVARCMVQVKLFDKALLFSKKIVSGVGSLCLDGDIIDTWTKAIIVFVKCSVLGLWEEDSKVVTTCQTIWSISELFETGKDLGEVRKQVISAKFDKHYTEGYGFALLYILMDAIGRALQPPISDKAAHLPLDAFNFLTREAHSLIEACDNILRINGDLTTKEMPLSRVSVWRKQVTFVFIVMRLICDRVSKGNEEIDADTNIVVDNCYRTQISQILLVDQMNIIMEEKNVAEVLARRLAQYLSNIAFGYHKRSCYEEAYKWSTNTCELQQKFQSSGIASDIKISTSSVSLLSVDCLMKLGKPEEGLHVLAKLLVMEPDRLENPGVAFDIYEQIAWSDWNHHWIQLQIQARNLNKNFKKTLLDLITDDDASFLLDDNALSRILRYELNSYFTSRQVVPGAIIHSSEKLIENASNSHDVVLGMLGRAIGYYWGDYDEVLFANDVIQDALLYAEKEFSNEADLTDSITPFSLALVIAWKGILLLRKSQYYVEREMEILKQQLLNENPEKYGGRDDTGEERTVLGFSSLNYEHESEWTSCLINATEILLRFSESETTLRILSEEYCPALVLTTSRIVASALKAVGDAVNAAKAWFVVNKLSQIFDRKGLNVLSASEILKIVPDVEMSVIVEAELAIKIAIDTKLVKQHNRAPCYRIYLAKSIAYFNLQMYPEGIQQLLEVFRFFDEKNDFDSAHHLLADATYVFSLYRSVQFQNQLDFSKFPDTLRCMSHVGLATKGCNLLGGLTRYIDIDDSGWTDLFHNYYLLGSLMEVGTHSLKLLKEAGRDEDLKCLTIDAVNFTQHCGLISRSVGMVVNIIDLDMEATNFYQAQMKIDVVRSIFAASNCLPDESVVADDEYSKLMDTIELPEMSAERLESISDFKWKLKQIDVPSMYYGNRSKIAITTQVKNLREGFDMKDMSIPRWIRHHHGCCCYICSHPTILPITFQFYLIQARYLSCMADYKNSMAVLKAVRLYMERVIYRLIFNLSPIAMSLTAMTSKTYASKAVEIIYTPFCVNPGIESLHHEAMLCPSSDLKMILNAIVTVLQIKATIAPMDIAGKLTAVQLGICACYRRLVEHDELQLKDLELLTFIEERILGQEKENVAKSGTRTESSPVSTVNSKSRLAVKKKNTIANKKGHPVNSKTHLAVKKNNKIANKNQKPHHVSKFPMPNVEIIDITEEIDNSESSQTIPTTSFSFKPPSSGQSARSLSTENAASSIGTRNKLVGCSKLVEVDIPGAILETRTRSSRRNLRSDITERKRSLRNYVTQSD